MARRRWRLPRSGGLALLTLTVLMAPPLLGLAEFNPAVSSSATGTWEARAPSEVERQEGAYVLVDGTFYLGGGTTVHEAYDPLADRWERVAPLPANLDHIQSVTVDGRIYYVGGLASWPAGNVDTVHIYDPQTDTFTTGAPMLDGGQGGGGVAVHGGRIYYAGGTRGGDGGSHRGADAVDAFSVYDPATDTWTSLAPMPRARDHFHAVVADGRFWAIGGRDVAIDATTAAVDVYDFATDTWETIDTQLPTPRGGFAAAVLGDEILIIGGEGGGDTFAEVEAYDISSNTWRELAPMPTPRHGIQAAMCNGGIAIASGGTTQGGGHPGTAHEVFFLDGPRPCGSPGTAPEGWVTAPPSLAFGEVSLDAEASGAVVVRNSSHRLIQIVAQQVTGADAFTVPPLGHARRVPAGEETQIVVTFAPSAAGTAVAELVIGHTGAEGPLRVELSGSGVASPVESPACPAPSSPNSPAPPADPISPDDDPQTAPLAVFNDIAGSPHRAAILRMAGLGILSGFGDGNYGPGTAVTRGQLATLLHRTLSLPNTGPSGFSDVGGSIHEPGIAAVAAAGITTGFADGTFRPYEPISRGQVATFLQGAYEIPPGDDPSWASDALSDVPGSVHESAIRAITAAGLVQGHPDGTFRPRADMTRGQLATVLDRMHDRT